MNGPYFGPCTTIRQYRDRDQDRQNRKDAELEAAREADSFSFGRRHKFTKTRLRSAMGNPNREVIVSFACNDPDNGEFIGRAPFCNWKTNHKKQFNVDMDFDHDDFEKGTSIGVDDNLMTITIHGVAYPWKRRIPWYGNWCWDGFVMKRPAAMRLLKALASNGKWNCTSAPAKMESWFDRSKANLDSGLQS